MFMHIFLTRLKILLRNRELIFWTLLFPIALGTFFNLAFSNLNASETFKAINLAVVDNEYYQKDENFKAALEGASQGENKLFNLKVVSAEEARKLLNDNKIAGYISLDPAINLIVNKSGLDQNIIKNFIDSYSQTVSSVSSIMAQNPTGLEALLKDLNNRQEYTTEVSGSSSEPNNVLNYFYTLIAMTCFYGALFGNLEIKDIQADLSTLAARINMAPVHKFKAFISSMCASCLIFFTEILILMAYLVFVLKVDFGTRTGLVLLTSFIGSVTGVSFGAFISATVKKDENFKVGIIIGSTMFCSFLAGMMYQKMKYIIAENVPVLSYLNPINVLTDAFYSLYYYDKLSRYIVNISVLTAFVAVFWVGTYLLIRRRKYASL